MAARASKIGGLSSARNRPKFTDLNGVYEHVFASIVDQRLPPGTKLNELTLCNIFNVGRRHVVQVLTRLAQDRLVTIFPNRGAFVTVPDAGEARAIFGARKIIEPEVTRVVASSATRESLTPLRRNVDLEAGHRRDGRIREAIWLSGEFHILLGELGGNSILAGLIRQLVARTSLVVSLYQIPDVMSCWHEDHRAMLKHLEQHRAAAAVALMRRHLANVEESLDLNRRRNERFDLRAIYVC